MATDRTEPERKLAAILAADVVGYSRLMQADDQATLAALTKSRALFSEKVANHGGRIVNAPGDSILSEFASALNAVQCALDIQRMLLERNAALPEPIRMQFRMGVNLGDVLVDAAGIYGDGVNVAARLESLAAPGGICISRSVHEQVKNRLQTSFEDLGEQTVKNIAEPVRVFRMALESVVPSSPALQLPDKPSLAVLPFENLSGDREQEYFADGVVDDIITALSRVKWFFVIARNSSFTYKGKAVDIKQVGRELGVRYVLEGSLRKAGNRVRITAQLIEAENGRHVWADRFEGNLEDIFDLQDRITASVVGAIEPNLRQAEFDRARKRPTASLQAYDYVLRAWQNLSTTSSRQGNDEALRDLRRAIELDPDYSAAKALYAWACQLRKSALGGATEAETDDGLRMAREALSAHHDDPITLATAGWALCWLGARHDEATDAVDRALTLAPNIASVLNHAGWVRFYAGDPASAIEMFQRAMRLSPLDSQMAHLLTGLAFSYLMAGRYEESLAAAQRATRERPDYVTPNRAVLVSLVELGRLEEAKVVAQRVRELAPQFTISWWMRSNPFKDQAFKTRYAAALRAAGLPD